MTDHPASGQVRVRMAPSPTGPIHIGNVHTAMFNWLFARQRGGVFILRFEDTDRARSESRWEDVIYEELHWLGMDWDEAPDKGGPHGPYRQTERLDTYQQWAERLLALGAAYECYCTVEELDAERQAAQDAGRAYQYSRKCRHLSEAERMAIKATGRKPAIRFAIPDNRTVVVDDLVRGPIEYPTSALSDPIIVRPNGMPLYNFAVVVDDLMMQVTHVLRGEGHISNTPLQVLIYEALGQTAPAFGHFGHINSGAGEKFSKRKGEGYIGYYREIGILPEAMFNYLALLAWTPRGDREILTQQEIIAEFDVHRVTAAPSQFDLRKLYWVNGNHIRRLSVPELAQRCLPFLVAAGLITEPVDDATMHRVQGVISLEQTRIESLQAIAEATSYFFVRDIAYATKAERMVGQPEARAALTTARDLFAALPEWSVPALEQAGQELLAATGLAAKDAFQPVRAAITGRVASPPLFDTLYWLGREWALERIDRVLSGEPLPKAEPAAQRS